MKKNYTLILISAIVMQSCQSSIQQQDSATVDSASVEVFVDTMPQASIKEEIVQVDSAKNYYHESTEEEKRQEKEAYEKIFGPSSYSIGAKTSVVIKVEGQPNSVTVAGPYKTFYYGRNSVTFYNGRLQEYSNYDGKLKIKIEE